MDVMVIRGIHGLSALIRWSLGVFLLPKICGQRTDSENSQSSSEQRKKTMVSCNTRKQEPVMCVSLNIHYSKISGSSMFINVSLKISLLVGGFNRARNAAEVWKFFHNGYADKAAKTANQARSEAFWQFWEEHVQATERARRLAQQVTALQLAIGKRHVRAQNDITDVIEQGPRVTREFVPCFAFGNWTGQMVPNAARLFGTAHVTRAMRWLEARLVTDDTAEPQWLSFTQLYLDYQMTWSNPGPLRVQQQWVDLSSRPYLTVATIPFRTRVRWFRQFLKAIWKEGGLQATMDQCRPASQMIQAYVPCFALPWAKHAVQIVDSWLGQELTAPCTRAAGALKALPVPKQCPELRLLDP